MKINHNISALNAYRNLAVNNSNTASSLEKLSSGLRINRAADDAAGLAISEKMRSQIRGLNMAERNTLDAISFVQTAEGALSSTHEILQRMRELSVQSANDSNTDVDRQAIQKEINQLTNEVNRIANTTEFNTKKLLNGDLMNLDSDTADYNGATETAKLAMMQIGANTGQTVGLEIKNMNALFIGISSETGGEAPLLDGDEAPVLDELGEEITVYFTEEPGSNKGIDDELTQSAIDVSTTDDTSTAHEKAAAAIKAYDVSIQRVSDERSRLGAIQNRLEHTVNNLKYMAENVTASESRIRDLDMALEMTDYTKNNILVQSAQAMLAQANQLPQGVLQLLQ